MIMYLISLYESLSCTAVKLFLPVYDAWKQIKQHAL